MNKDKQIEEKIKAIVENAEGSFDQLNEIIPEVKKRLQIEEMAKNVCHLDRTCDECMVSFECKAMMYAKRFYTAGYRKASDLAREIFAEIEEGIKAAVSALQFENNPIHRKVKHETYSSLMRFVKNVEKKYTQEK